MQLTLFDLNKKTAQNISNPNTYKGIYSFHKYWGKKPIESLAFFIEKCTKESDIVLDPFLGSGFISRECLDQKRRFIGIDLNPFSIEHTNFLLELPHPDSFKSAFKIIENKVKQKINETYLLENGQIASHYLWQDKTIQKIWIKPDKGNKKIEIEPTFFDREKINNFSNYAVKNIREIRFFSNSRINSNKEMSIYDLFTRRALYNIDLLLNEIKLFPEIIQRALLLTLTAASGQMSSLVFAITNRGKNKNQISDKIEVGSWVIGYWRPPLHFEINVWNCFENKAKKLDKTLLNLNNNYQKYNSIHSILNKKEGACIINGDCLNVIKNIPDRTIKLICTDPPHGDRIPYLELSEMWNAILNKNVIFEEEIVISNAKERNKKKNEYLEKMTLFMNESQRILTDDGILSLYFNARDRDSWKFLDIVENQNKLQLMGVFPLEYSANSVVQDNRKGGLKKDYVMVFKKTGANLDFQQALETLPGWSTSLPKITL